MAAASASVFRIDHPARVLHGDGRLEDDGSDPEIVMSPESLYPREVYEIELWFHMAATHELLVAAGYPTHRNRGPGVALPTHLAGRGAQTTPEVFEACVRNLRTWVDRWVRGKLEDRMEDVRSFALDDHRQAWLHSWMNNRTHGWPIQYRNWGGLSLCLLMGVEKPVLEWVTRLHQHFLRQSNVNFMDGRVTMCMDGYQFSPRLSKGMMEVGKFSDKRPYDPYDPKVLPNVFRIDERLTYDPDMHIYGKLDVERGQPASHILFMANVSPFPHLAAEGDVGLVFSKDSHTVAHEDRVRRLAEAVEDPERGVMQIREHCYVRNTVTLEAIKKAMEPAPPGGFTTITWTGVELTDQLGATVKKMKAKRLVDATTSPLWVGPARRVDMKPGTIVAWPSNLIYGFCPAPVRQSSFHLTKRLNYCTSFMASQRFHHPQHIAWMHAWGHDVRTDAERRKVRMNRTAKGTTKQERRHVSQQRTSLTFVPDSIASIMAPPAPPTTAATAATTPAAAEGDGDAERVSKALTRTVSDVTHHADSAFGYTNCSAFAFAFSYVPETKTFFSLPFQLARALRLRFPNSWQGTETMDLARNLAAGGRDWNDGPPEAVEMIRNLWEMFEK
jgi:hypothetical protein